LVLSAVTFLAIGNSHAQEQPIEAVPVSIAPELREHTEHFRKKVYRVGRRVYSAVGWNIANIVMIVGDAGVILVDAGLSPDTSREVLQEFRKITDKPIRAIIYSHFHHDHIDGIKGLVSEAEVAADNIRLIAHRTLVDNLADESQLLGPILALRGGYTFGFLLGPEDREGMNAGIGPLPIGGRPGSFIVPNELVDDRLMTVIAGVRLEIIHAPSEAPDELAVYLPDDKVLIDTEVIQGPTFPNVYSLRGTKFREPATWVRSIDKLRQLEAEHLVPTHGQPVSGAARVDEVLRMTRDGIQFVLDQTIRFMNKGYTPDELVQRVRLPPHLASYSPYLRQYYGTVPQAVRAIYAGYLGWFEGDPVALQPVPRRERDRRLIRLMGGAAAVLSEAQQAYAAEDFQWAAELATMLIRIDSEALQARTIKAAAFRQLGYRSININWRNWYLTSAMELEGTLTERLAAVSMRGVFLPPDIVAALPAAAILNSWTSRLKAEEVLDVAAGLGVQLTDSGENFGLVIDRGVCRFQLGVPADADLVLLLEREILDKIVTGETSFAAAVQSGTATLLGSQADYLDFVGYFEDPWAGAPALTVR
ncbi:MAG: alkyl sulfatase dimerization domain-containing protein, partial [Gammaproteobacteria bacterium]|nr:alkyl sulfatase dimerization domain-containing protein [Gammaproteobacteria bacterium]